MIQSQNLGVFFSTVHYVTNPTISSVLIDFVFDLNVARSCFDRRLFFVNTPRRDTPAAVSDTHCRWLLWL
jgi:hypothetical protein